MGCGCLWKIPSTTIQLDPDRNGHIHPTWPYMVLDEGY